MWDEMLRLAVNHGLMAGLFVGLLIFVLRDSAKREKKYQETIKGLVSNLQVVKDIKQDVEEIKKKVKVNDERKAPDNCCQD